MNDENPIDHDHLQHACVADPPHIKELPNNVVMRIAAGEVIQQPVCALKELIDNALDAQSSHITVRLGPRNFRIRDDGYGIRFEDLPILCRRHTTSKLRSFAELHHVKTLGFRGEALCSISHVGRLTVTTRPMTSSYGMRAVYLDGTLLDAPVPCAAHVGTTVTVEFISPFASKLMEEAVTEMFRSYALHSVGVGFTLERGSGMQLRVGKHDVTMDRLLKLYGIDIAQNAQVLKTQDCDGLCDCDVFGYGSWREAGKRHFIIFINDRYVNCRPMKKATDSVYSDCLPKKMPFAYLSLHLPPETVDVNIHPAKQEVAFLNKEQIIQSVTACVREALLHSQLNDGTQDAVMSCDLPKFLPRLQAVSHFKRGPLEAVTPPDESQKHVMHVQISNNEGDALDAELRGILKNQNEENAHKECQWILQGHTLIGILDGIHAFVQFQNGLYLLNMEILSHDFMTQMLWAELGKLKAWKLETPLPIPMEHSPAQEQTLLMAEAAQGTRQASVCEDREVCPLDASIKSAALTRLLSIEISMDGHLLSLPLLFPWCPPNSNRLPAFCKELRKLIGSWNGSIMTLHPIIDVVAALYSIHHDDANDIHSESYALEMLERMRCDYRPTIERIHDGSLVKLTTVHALCSRFGR